MNLSHRKNRWQQRFENFERAFNLLRNTCKEKSIKNFSELEKEGIVQRFEYTFELSWKTLKDYLEYTGIILEQITPRQVIKQAFAANIIKDGQTWIDMLEHRNLMSHTYDPKSFEKAVEAIAKQYVPIMEEIFLLLKYKSSEK